MNHPIVEALGLALLHSLWECSLAALLFAALTLVFRSSNARYLAGCLAMLLMLAIPAITFVGLLDDSTATVAVASIAAPSPHQDPSTSTDPRALNMPADTPSFFALIVWIWLTGVIAMTAWSAAGWVAAQRLKRRSARPIEESWR